VDERLDRYHEIERLRESFRVIDDFPLMEQ
jgi:hypothetical protein